MRAAAGDRLTVKGRRQGDDDRHGMIIEVHGTDGAQPYLVRWRDDQGDRALPSPDAVVVHHPAADVAGAERGE